MINFLLKEESLVEKGEHSFSKSMFVRSLLVVSILMSWGAVFALQRIFTMDVLSVSFYLLMFTIFLCWLTPFTLLVLFSREDATVFGAFALGAAGFLFLSHTIYAFAALLLFALGFFYWQRQVRRHIHNTRTFSWQAMFQGMGLFFTTLSLLIAFFYFDSPFGKGVSFEPKVPENIYDFVYSQVSSTSFFQSEQTPRPTLSQEEKIKSTIYEQMNSAFKKFALPYIQYIPVIFAAGLFLALKGFFIPFKYLMGFVVFLLQKLLLAAGVLKKNIIKIDKEEIGF